MEKIDMRNVFVVVESNDLNTNITLMPCLSYDEAKAVFQGIREEYLEDAGGNDAVIEEDYPELFSVRMSCEGDFIVTVQIQKLWK